MRMRKKKNLAPRMARCEALLIGDPAAHRGQWRALCPGCRALSVELGCGKGRYTAETAALEPDTLFLALERVEDALVVAMERAARAELRNLFFLSADARQLPDFFAPGEVDRVVINFCDPWRKRRQAARRLTHGDFLARYRAVLAPGGELHFKTDNVPLFDFSVAELARAGYTLLERTDDLHADGVRGVMTDYEHKFYEAGVPIHRLVARVPAAGPELPP